MKTNNKEEPSKAERQGCSYVVDYTYCWEKEVGSEQIVLEERESFLLNKGQVSDLVFSGVSRMDVGQKEQFRLKATANDFASPFCSQPVPLDATILLNVRLIRREKKTLELLNARDTINHDANHVALAEECKKKGNEEYQKHRYNEANSLYKSALRHLQKVRRTSNNENEQEELRNSILHKVWIPCQLNAAAAELQMCKFSDAITRCSMVLEVDNNNLKALYRRSQAKHGNDDLESAIEDIHALLSLDNSNKAGGKLLRILEEDHSRVAAKEKEFASNMFLT